MGLGPLASHQQGHPMRTIWKSRVGRRGGRGMSKEDVLILPPTSYPLSLEGHGERGTVRAGCRAEGDTPSPSSPSELLTANSTRTQGKAWEGAVKSISC